MSHAWESCLNQQKFLKMIVWIHNGQKPLFLFHTRCGDTFPNVAFQNSNLSFNLFQFSFQPKKTPFTIVLWNGAAEIMTHLRHVHAKLLFSKHIFFSFAFFLSFDVFKCQKQNIRWKSFITFKRNDVEMHKDIWFLFFCFVLSVVIVKENEPTECHFLE